KAEARGRSRRKQRSLRNRGGELLAAELSEGVDGCFGFAVADDGALEVAGGVEPFGPVTVEEIDSPRRKAEAGGGELLGYAVRLRVAAPIGVMTESNAVKVRPSCGVQLIYSEIQSHGSAFQ